MDWNEVLSDQPCATNRLVLVQLLLQVAKRSATPMGRVVGNLGGSSSARSALHGH